jgi:hypothetical protein
MPELGTYGFAPGSQGYPGAIALVDFQDIKAGMPGDAGYALKDK